MKCNQGLLLNYFTLALELRFQTATRKVLQFPQLFHNQVRDGLVWVQLSKEHQGTPTKATKKALVGSKKVNLLKLTNIIFFCNFKLATKVLGRAQ
jgi:hypothetical protein